uniref:Uncharacterized protein n=1 Tax=viral metagenome TaxID=1070528 RepID=A0A6C0EJX4_9ZZZZ
MAIIGICGQPLSGKTTYINTLVENLGLDKCGLLKLEDYKINNGFIPGSYDFEAFIADINVNLKPIILLEGNFIFSNIKLITKIDIKIYIDTNDDINMTDISKRYSQNQFIITNGIITFIKPSRKYADIIIFPNKRYKVSIDLLKSYINNSLKITL